ncbi:MAG TPA: DUF4390 domain-containing protein [Gemmatimonadaceae bacterium]|nr:DUF4390 domain-containing protein [Gemmatimonadaceae bacterium]
MLRPARSALVVGALLVTWSAPTFAQRRTQLEVSAPSAAAPSMVTAFGLFSDPDMRELVRSGFPLSLKFRLELWRSGGLFNDLEGRQEWELTILYDPSAQRYRVARRQGGRVDDLGSFATLATAQSVLERPLRVTLLPRREGSRYYYNFALEMEALSVSDMDKLEQWLRGVRGGTAATALSSGVRTLMLRMLGGERQSFEKRSPTFIAAR